MGSFVLAGFERRAHFPKKSSPASENRVSQQIGNAYMKLLGVFYDICWEIAARHVQFQR